MHALLPYMLSPPVPWHFCVLLCLHVSIHGLDFHKTQSHTNLELKLVFHFHLVCSTAYCTTKRLSIRLNLDIGGGNCSMFS